MLTGAPIAKYTPSLEQRISTLAGGSSDQEALNRVPQQDVETAIEQSKQWAATLSPAHTELIHEWTGIGHRSMPPERLAELRSAIQTAPEYNGRAYRIVVNGSAGEGCMRSATMGKCLDLKLFFHYEKKHLRPRVIEIDLTNAPGKVIAGASRAPSEKEVLIEPDVTLKFTHTKKQWNSCVNCYAAQESEHEN